MHRDIKPDNFLFSSDAPDATVKLADFGLSTFFRRRERQHEAVGSPYYMGPELSLGKGYGPEMDIWSCGVVLFAALSGNDLPAPAHRCEARALPPKGTAPAPRPPACTHAPRPFGITGKQPRQKRVRYLNATPPSTSPR